MDTSHDITQLLNRWSSGDTQALGLLMELVYPELHQIAARSLKSEREGHTLQPTALVHEAYLRLSNRRAGKGWTDRTHFFAVAARVVRAVLVDHARARNAVKRGDGESLTTLTDARAVVVGPSLDVLDLEAALRELEQMNPVHCRILEMRFFGGLSVEETAAALGVSPATVKRGWLAAKTFVRRRLEGEPGAAG